MHAAAVRFDLHVPASRSLKHKRAAIRPVVDGLRHRFHVSVAEVGFQEQWQRAAVGVALVAPTDGRLHQVIDTVERFVRTQAEIEVLDVEVVFLDGDGFLELDAADDRSASEVA